MQEVLRCRKGSKDPPRDTTPMWVKMSLAAAWIAAPHLKLPSHIKVCKGFQKNSFILSERVALLKVYLQFSKAS